VDTKSERETNTEKREKKRERMACTKIKGKRSEAIKSEQKKRNGL
jgi:hypothetical protein